MLKIFVATCFCQRNAALPFLLQGTNMIIEKMRRSIIKSDNIVLVVMVLASTTLLIVANYCGVGFTYDSYRYVEIAKQVDNNGFLLTEGFNTKPPLYPLLLYWLGEKAIFPINIVCFLITFCILGFFGYAIRIKLLRWLFWAATAFATPLYLVHSFAWTEPLFIVILLLVFYLTHTYQQHCKPTFLYTALALLFVLPFIRFAGIFIVIPTLLVILLRLPKHLRWRFIIVVCVGVLVLSVWIWQFEVGFARRWHTFTAPIVGANISRYTINVDSYLEALSIWILPLPIYKPIRTLLASATLLVIGIAAVNFFREKNYDIQSGLPFIFLCYYLLLHLVFGVEYYTAERYLTPMYNLLILSLFLWLDQRFSTINKGIRRVTWIILFALLVYNVGRTTKNVLFWSQLRCAVILQNSG